MELPPSISLDKSSGGRVGSSPIRCEYFDCPEISSSPASSYPSSQPSRLPFRSGCVHCRCRSGGCGGGGVGVGDDDDNLDDLLAVTDAADFQERDSLIPYLLHWFR